MKHGFLNATKVMEVIKEVYTPKAPPGPDPAHEVKKPAHESEGGENLTAVKGGIRNDKPANDPTSSVEETSATPLAPGSNFPPAYSKGKRKRKKVIMNNYLDNTDPPDEDTTERSNVPIRPPRGRPGWGFQDEEEVLHRVPPQSGLGNRKRAVFLEWPRDPRGWLMIPSNRCKGKVSPDGYPWGATLLDFFRVSKIPNDPGIVYIMTGSKLLEEMEAMDELTAKDALAWVLSEPEPRDESFPMGAALLEDYERFVHWGCFNHCSALDDVRKRASYEENRTAKGEDQKMSVPSSLDIPITSPFHHSHYPSPWPLIPFTCYQELFLQDHIPLYLLPQTLHVHDPFGVLSAVHIQAQNPSWTSKPDIIHTYNLSLVESRQKEVEEARKEAEALEEFKARTLIIMRYARTKEQKENYEPIIEVPLPPYPKRPTGFEESHLYLSPVAKVGTGHHSFVYKGEWEVPRDLVVQPKICASCFQESLEKEKKQLKDTGRWDEMLRAARCGPKGFAGAIPTTEEINALEGVHGPPIPDSEKDNETIEREVTCVVPPGATPMEVLDALEERGFWNIFTRQKERNIFLIQLAEDEVYPDATCTTHPPPVMRINASFLYYNPSHRDTLCSHVPEAPVPRTAKFTVVTKLSIQNDPQLEIEAENYQRFPDHFFQHWSGYTIISQLHTIVPVRAIVPQFYGYYTQKSGQKRNKPYLSPILLIEHCGMPIDPDKLSVDDREECASLLLRFIRAGWLHRSVYPRNIVFQRGSPILYPWKRRRSKDLNFRLIDFGRSKRSTYPCEMLEEEIDVLRLFNGLTTSSEEGCRWMS